MHEAVSVGDDAGGVGYDLNPFAERIAGLLDYGTMELVSTCDHSKSRLA